MSYVCGECRTPLMTLDQPCPNCTPGFLANQYPPEGGKLSDEAQGLAVGAAGAPFFALSASDPLAPAIVKHWIELSRHNRNVQPQEREKARRVALAMELWQKDHGMVP